MCEIRHDASLRRQKFAIQISALIISFGIVMLFALKFCLLIYSSQELFGEAFVRLFNYMIVEPFLKLLVNVNNWLNACVAGERAFAVFQVVTFRKKASRQTAAWSAIISVFTLNIILLVPQVLQLRLFYDPREDPT